MLIGFADTGNLRIIGKFSYADARNLMLFVKIKALAEGMRSVRAVSRNLVWADQLLSSLCWY